MSDAFVKGIAFILEGQTELVFYPKLLQYFCLQHPGWLLIEQDSLSACDASYVLRNSAENLEIIINLHCFSAISQIVHSNNWFHSNCIGKHKKIPWDIFLCYDTDTHNNNITKFHEGDWKELRKNLTHKNTTIVDMAASADIEDLFLKDLKGISNFFNREDQLIEDDIPNGRKGKVRLKNLFRNYGKCYHEGSRAEPLIDSLDFKVLIDSKLLPLEQIEKACFDENTLLNV